MIEVENLESTKVKVTGKSTNSSTFSIEPSTFIIPPKSKFPVKLIYTPSNLELETADISFESELG
jgi:P pilus assembly chaperone PapD